tara:strand:- start:715 stop:1146 length:432 start_codon:yes stop_codon:yes gene_type:complete
MENKKIFNSFKELGSYLKRKRREGGERLESVSSKLLIKKNILQNIENGIFDQSHYEKNSYLKGFLKTYMKDLNIMEDCDIENLFLKNMIDIKRSTVSLDNAKIDKNRFGSLVILISLVLLGLLFLLWNKSTYQKLYELEKYLN